MLGVVLTVSIVTHVTNTKKAKMLLPQVQKQKEATREKSGPAQFRKPIDLSASRGNMRLVD
jgi:hypothetical protein